MLRVSARYGAPTAAAGKLAFSRSGTPPHSLRRRGAETLIAASLAGAGELGVGAPSAPSIPRSARQ
eukprot:11348774-Alexandrium_andersonii.AAC.1